MQNPSAPKLVLVSSDFDMSSLIEPLLRAAPELRVMRWGDPGASDADVAVCWNPPLGSLRTLPSLRLVHAIAAGVDNILADPTLPDVPLCRVADASQARLMSEFVLWGVLHFHRGLDRVLANQRKGVWELPAQRRAIDYVVGIMGLGEMGGRVAADIR
jgi:glyoxylate/hydroxypyruvate reductase